MVLAGLVNKEKDMALRSVRRPLAILIWPVVWLAMLLLTILIVLWERTKLPEAVHRKEPLEQPFERNNQEALKELRVERRSP